MKSFLKFLVTIVVILVMVFTVHFLAKNMSQYNANNNSGDLIIDDLNNNQSGNIEINSDMENQSGNTEINSDMENQSGNIEINNEQNQELEQEFQNGDNKDFNSDSIKISGEMIINSGDKYLINDWDSKIEAIKKIENQNKSAVPSKTIEDNVGIDIMGNMVQDFMESFETDELAVTVQVAGSMVYIIPASDFLDNTQFHYDENGNLILYIREFIGIGGEARYYFENGTPIIINMKVDKKNQMQFESTDEILQRSKIVYDKYMK